MDRFEALHQLPKYSCICGVSVVYTIIYFMMQSFVSNVRDSILLFGVGSLITFSSYFVMNYYLNIYSSSYRDIPDDRKFYVLSNLIKSGLLAIYTPHCIEMLFYLNNLGRNGIMTVTALNQSFVENRWIFGFFPNSVEHPPIVTTIHHMGALYAIPDFVSMFLVPNMAWSTIIHHISVVIFSAINYKQPYDKPSIWIAIIVYGLYSSFSYAVNFLLASRFLPLTSDKREQKCYNMFLTQLAFWIYSICCLFNWSWQAYYSYSYGTLAGWGWEMGVYGVLISAFVRDDLVLLQWLAYKKNKLKNN